MKFLNSKLTLWLSLMALAIAITACGQTEDPAPKNSANPALQTIPVTPKIRKIKIGYHVKQNKIRVKTKFKVVNFYEADHLKWKLNKKAKKYVKKFQIEFKSYENCSTDIPPNLRIGDSPCEATTGGEWQDGISEKVGTDDEIVCEIKDGAVPKPNNKLPAHWDWCYEILAWAEDRETGILYQLDSLDPVGRGTACNYCHADTSL